MASSGVFLCSLTLSHVQRTPLALHTPCANTHLLSFSSQCEWILVFALLLLLDTLQWVRFSTNFSTLINIFVVKRRTAHTNTHIYACERTRTSIKRHTDDTHMYTRCCCFWEQQFYCCLLTTGLTIDVRVVLPNYVRCLYVNMQAIEMYLNMFSAAFC